MLANLVTGLAKGRSQMLADNAEWRIVLALGLVRLVALTTSQKLVASVVAAVGMSPRKGMVK